MDKRCFTEAETALYCNDPFFSNLRQDRMNGIRKKEQ